MRDVTSLLTILPIVSSEMLAITATEFPEPKQLKLFTHGQSIHASFFANYCDNAGHVFTGYYFLCCDYLVLYRDARLAKWQLRSAESDTLPSISPAVA